MLLCGSHCIRLVYVLPGITKQVFLSHEHALGVLTQHYQWSKIKGVKGAMDRERGRLFSRANKVRILLSSANSNLNLYHEGHSHRGAKYAHLFLYPPLNCGPNSHHSRRREC